MQSSTTTAGRLSTKMIGDKPLLVPDRDTTGDGIGMEDKANENVEEINANYVTSEVSRGLGNMEKKNGFFDDKSHNERALEAECHGDDRDVDIVVDDSPPERERTSTDVAQTTGQTINVRSEKGAKDDDGIRSQSRRRRRRNEDKNTVGSNQEPAPTRHRWKRVGTSL